jgi:hypothetical protein
MAHVVTDLDTTASPERVIGALTDFSPKRFDLFPNVDRSYFKLESSGETSAEVTEGSPVFGGVWERGLYDWSCPGTVRIDVKDSNGGSHVHMEFDRRPRNLKGKLVSALLSVIGKKIFEKQRGVTLRHLENTGDMAPPTSTHS